MPLSHHLSLRPLTPDEKVYVRQQLLLGRTLYALALELGVRVTTVYDVKYHSTDEEWEAVQAYGAQETDHPQVAEKIETEYAQRKRQKQSAATTPKEKLSPVDNCIKLIKLGCSYNELRYIFFYDIRKTDLLALIKKHKKT